MDELACFREQAAGLWGFLRENSQALSELAVIAFGAIGIPLLWIRTRAADRQARAANEQARIANVQAKTSEQGHITDRFTKAIEQLGSEKIEVRVGGIYALERISRDSLGDYWTIMEVLMGYLREKATAQWALKVEAGILQTREGETETTSPAAEHDPSHTQVAQLYTPELVEMAERACSAVLGEGGPLKFRAEADVQSILTVLGRRSEKGRAWELQAGRCLDLVCTDLRAAWLSGAHLERADLRGADLRGASLRNAKLSGCWLNQANLRHVQGLTQDQLNEAHGDEHTILPAGQGLTRPAHWLKPEPDPSPATQPPSPPPPPEAPPDTRSHTSR